MVRLLPFRIPRRGAPVCARRLVRVLPAAWISLLLVAEPTLVAGCAAVPESGASGDAPGETEGPTPAGEARLPDGSVPAGVKPDTVRLRVVSTNDFHGALLPTTPGWADGREVGGSAALATYFRGAREAHTRGPTLLVSGGDLYQGTAVSNLLEGRPTIAFYNRVGYAAAALGNHEFDWGVDVLAERAEQADFPLLAANVVYEGTDSVPPWIRPVTRFTLGPDSVRVGIVGLITPSTPYVTLPENVEGLVFGPVVAAVDRWVPRLRSEGMDFVVVVGHLGGECREAAGGSVERPGDGEVCEGELVELARGVRHRPDLLLGGHTPGPVATAVNGIPLVQGRSRGARFGVTDLWRVRGVDGARGARILGLPVAWTDGVEPDSAVAALVARAEERVRPLAERPVATLAGPLERRGREYGLGRLVADAQRRATGADVALMNNGGIRADLPAGTVTWGDVLQLHPFGNTLVVLTLTGEQLREAVEHGLSEEGPRLHLAGLEVVWDPARSPGRRVVGMRGPDGAPVEPRGRYRVVVNNFMADGGEGYEVFGEALERDATGISDMDAFLAHLKALPSPVRAPLERRFRRVGREPSNLQGDGAPMRGRVGKDGGSP